MMATPQQIAEAYQATVGKGLMSQAEFISRAQSEFQVTPAQLVAAQAILVGADNPVVQNNLRALPQQEVVNYLRASTPAQNQITPTQDLNALGGMITEGRGAGGEMFRPIYTGGAGEGETPQLAGYAQYLAEFDPTYEGGEYGSYIGVYDTQGNLVDVKFQKGERSGGFINENQELLGNLAIAALTGGAGVLPQLGSIGSAAATGAVLGAGRAAVNDQNIFRGALTGGALAGLTAGAADYLRSLGTPTTTLTTAGAPGEVLSSFQTLDDAATGLNWGADPFGAELSFGQQTIPGFGPTTAAAVATPTPTTTTPTATTPAGGGPTVGQVATAGVAGATLKELAAGARDVRDVVSAGDTLRDLVGNEDDTLRQAIDDALREAGLDGDRTGGLTDDEFRQAIDDALRDAGLSDEGEYDRIVDQIRNLSGPDGDNQSLINQIIQRLRQQGGGTTTGPGTTQTGTNWGQIIGQLANAFGGYQSSQAAKEAAQIQAELGREALGLQREMFERQIGLQEPFRQGGLSAQNRLMDLLGLGYSPEQIAEEYRQRTSAGMSEGDFVNWARSQGISDNRLLQARNMLLGGRGGMGAGMGDFGSAARPFTMESFRADPGYAFRLGEGLKALERSAAARGGLMSGATGKALQRYGQEAASQEYGNAFNRFYTERNALLNPLLALSGRGQTSASESGQAGQQFGQQAANTLTGIGNVMASGQVGQANAINQAIGQGVSMYNQAQNQNLLNQVLARSMG